MPKQVKTKEHVVLSKPRPGPDSLQDGHRAPCGQGPVPKEHSLGQGEDNLLAEGEPLQEAPAASGRNEAGEEGGREEGDQGGRRPGRKEAREEGGRE